MSDEMTDEQIRVRVAELLGFVFWPPGRLVIPVKGMDVTCLVCSATYRHNGSYNWNEHESCGPMGTPCYGKHEWKLFAPCWTKDEVVISVPNYPQDLNACAEFEKTLTSKQWGGYSGELERIVRSEPKHLPEWNTVSPSYIIDALLIHATARQRCLAFITTMEGEGK